MIVEHKELTFHINNLAYTVDIGPDLDNEIEDGLKRFLDLGEDLSTQELLLAYLRKTQELIQVKKDVENTIQDLSSFKQNITIS